MQSDSFGGGGGGGGGGGSVVAAVQGLWAEGGAGAFAQGGLETLLGYLVAGSLSFGCTEVCRTRRTPRARAACLAGTPTPTPNTLPSQASCPCSLPPLRLLQLFFRLLKSAAGPANALLLSEPLLIVASAAAVTVCTLAVCPFEAVRPVPRALARGSHDPLIPNHFQS
eukprot:5909085-Pleurochrysis_carterae.AAC.1